MHLLLWSFSNIKNGPKTAGHSRYPCCQKGKILSLFPFSKQFSSNALFFFLLNFASGMSVISLIYSLNAKFFFFFFSKWYDKSDWNIYHQLHWPKEVDIVSDGKHHLGKNINAVETKANWKELLVLILMCNLKTFLFSTHVIWIVTRYLGQHRPAVSLQTELHESCNLLQILEYPGIGKNFH